MLLHPIYQLQLEGGYEPLAILLLSLAPPYLPHMIIWSLTVLKSIYQLNVHRQIFEGINYCLNTLKHSTVTYLHRDSPRQLN